VNIEVSCYGVLEQGCGTPAVSARLSGEQVSVAEVLEQLCGQFPELREYLPSTAYAVGDELVDRQYCLRPGETLVLLPPVSGG